VFRQVLPNRWLFGIALRLASWFQFVLPRRNGKFRHLPQFLTALGAGRAVPARLQVRISFTLEDP
jgi:hypothetical protein